MPQAKRQKSGATIFIPTEQENINMENMKAIEQTKQEIESIRDEMAKELAEIRKMKQNIKD